jgi:hypothetical protein
MKPLRTLPAIIERFGGLEQFTHVQLRTEGFMPLTIEKLEHERGPHGGVLVSVMHTHEQNGDLMRDPDVVFEVVGDVWSPLSYRQDSLGLLQEAVYVEDGKAMVRPKLLADISKFCRLWDRNLRDQGFLKAELPSL